MTEEQPTQDPQPAGEQAEPTPPPAAEVAESTPAAAPESAAPAPEPVPEPVEADVPAVAAGTPEPAPEAPPESEPSGDGKAAAAVPTPSNKRWYVVKVQSGREESIKEAIERRVKIEGLEEFFGQIIIPVEKRTEMRGGKRVTREHKLYPGYLMVEVEYNDRILYLFRETSGVGDFVGGSVNRPPPPMSQREVERMIGSQGQLVPGVTHAKPTFDKGDRVKVKDGTFAGMEGEVKELLEVKGLVRVELTIFGRPVPVELEYWQVEHM
ncbi:MAG: transcription termination/antitermination factor NusG [Planctomycetes bacterium]|nr:transcription termination/antitermination factor NusG [Planctomycetota bacterium]